MMESKLKTALFIFGIIAIILTFMPYIAMDYWWVRVFDFPHLQLTGLTLVALITYFIKFNFKFYGDYIFATVLLICFIIQVQKIIPFTGLSDHQIMASTNTNSLKLMNINVLQKNTDYSAVLNEIKRVNPDVLILSETNLIWKNKIASKISTEYTNAIEHPLDNTYGMLLYSKKNLINPQVNFLVSGDSIPSIETDIILDSGDIIKLYSIHPTPPMPQENDTSTDRDAEMMMIAKRSMNSKTPVIVIGDFNDVAWSQITTLFQEVSRLGDVRIGRGLYNSFNANNFLLRWPLDHIFVSPEFRVKYVERGNNVGSDHFPLITELTFEPEKAKEQAIEPPTKDQLERANKQIQNYHNN